MDSTEQPQRSEAVRRQAALLERVQKIARIGGWELDWQTKALTWTDETYRIHGVTRADYVPTLATAIEFYTPKDQPLIQQALRALAEQNQQYDLELQIIRPDGERRWVRAVGKRAEDEPGVVCGVLQDITERRFLEQEIVNVRERERSLFGFDVHDGLGQDLAGVSLLLGGVIASIPPRQTRLLEELRRIEALVRESIGTCRELAHGWSPTQRGRGGLIGAVRRLASRIEKHHLVGIKVHVRGSDWALAESIADHFFRIMQEAITNAVKHGHAQQVAVFLESSPVRIFLSVQDDGVGFQPDWHAGMGIKIMHHRARLMGAALTVQPRVHGGVRVRCCLLREDLPAAAGRQAEQ